MLERVDLTKIITYSNPSAYYGNVYVSWLDALSGKHHHSGAGGVITKETKKLSWVICGSEGGPNRRPANIEWIRNLRDQCVAAGVPFFLKQMEVNGKIIKMLELDGQVCGEYPNVQ